MINEPPAIDSGNILDLVLTSNPSLISTINTVTGMSDHETIFFDINMNPTRNNEPPHKVYNYRSTNCTKISQQYFNRKPDEQDVNSNWNFFHKNYTNVIGESILSRMTKSKQHLPWITRSIIRLQRKRTKLTLKQRKKTSGKHQRSDHIL